jgi:hypothetical protein
MNGPQDSALQHWPHLAGALQPPVVGAKSLKALETCQIYNPTYASAVLSFSACIIPSQKLFFALLVD